MSESETSVTGRREFLHTVVAALVDTQAEPAQRDVFVNTPTGNIQSISAKS